MTRPELEFTGERVVPGQVEAELWNEHIARYWFAARLAAGKRVADLGCGAGYGTALLAEHAAQATGVDIAPEAVEYAREHYQRANLHYRCAGATATGLASGAFDLITAYELIEHLSNWPELIAEAQRLLAPGGLFLVSTPNKHYYAEARVEAGANPFHVHEFEFEEFIGALRQTFPHVAAWAQNYTGATVMQPLESTAPAEVQLEAGVSAAGAHYYVALCSAAPPPPLPAFVHVPEAASMLREREMHIARLDAELAALRARHVEVQYELEASNRWAQDATSRAERELAAVRGEAQRALDDLQGRYNTDIAEANRHLDEAQRTIEERTAWALGLDAEVTLWRERMAKIRASRWYRLGRKLGLRLGLKPGEEAGAPPHTQ